MARPLLAIVLLVAAAHAQDVPALLKSAAAHLQRGESSQAIRDSKAALALDPRYAPAHLLLGQAYLAQRSVSMVAEAKAELQQALDLDPTLLWAHFYLAKIYIDLGRNDKAEAELERGLAQRPNVPHFLSLLGDVERQLGRPERSLELNRKALAEDPSLTPAHYYLALAYLDLKQESQATAELEASIRSQFVAPEMYQALGELYANQRRFREAEDLCRKAISLDATRPESYVALAKVYNAEGGASDKAIAAIRQALPAGRTFPATAYYQRLQADAWFELGRAYQARRMKSEAEAAFARAAQLR